MSKVTPEIYKHRPGLIRGFIVMLALVVAYGVMHFSDNLILMTASYFVIVTALDSFIYYALGIKSSDYADAEQLMTDDQTTLEGLDKYASDRRNIRIVSLLLALIIAGATNLLAPAVMLYAFCIGFFVATIIGLAILKPHYRKKYPIIVVRDDRYYVPGQGPRAGHVTTAMYAAGRLNGYTYGPIDG